MISDNEIIRQLEKQAKKEGVQPKLLEFYVRLLQLQLELKQQSGTPEIMLSPESIKDRIRQGQPLITFTEFKVDYSLLRHTMRKIVSLFVEYPELFGEISPSLLEDVDKQFIEKVVKDWLMGKEYTDLPQGVSLNLWKDIVQTALSPVLVGYSNLLLERVPQEEWRRGYCPVCGGSPDLSILDKESGARWLVCSRCDARWLFQRLECPNCGSKDQNALTYYTDDTGLYRLHVCDKCQHYIKTIDQRQAKTEVLIPLERILTLNIDEQAKHLGYHAGNVVRIR